MLLQACLGHVVVEMIKLRDRETGHVEVLCAAEAFLVISHGC